MVHRRAEHIVQTVKPALTATTARTPRSFNVQRAGHSRTMTRHVTANTPNIIAPAIRGALRTSRCTCRIHDTVRLVETARWKAARTRRAACPVQLCSHQHRQTVAGAVLTDIPATSTTESPDTHAELPAHDAIERWCHPRRTGSGESACSRRGCPGLASATPGPRDAYDTAR